MKPRFFIVCHILDLPNMFKSTCPLRYAVYHQLNILDGSKEKDKEDWSHMVELRKTEKGSKAA